MIRDDKLEEYYTDIRLIHVKVKKLLEDKMQELAKGDTDPEDAHQYADEILCDLLRMTGFSDIVDIYKRVEKWYA